MAAFAGFDSSGFPGLAVTSWLKANTNLQWCGFYLGTTPSHSGADWMPQMAALSGQGWGLAPIYVGQQVTGPGSHQTSGPQGITDGNQTIALMQAAGFTAGRFVYLDLENGTPFTQPQHDYIGTWVDTVQQGGFGAGVYCSHTFADQVHQVRPAARIWAFNVPTVLAHNVPGTNFRDSHPAGSGFPGAFMWQHDQHASITAAAGSLTVISTLRSRPIREPSPCVRSRRRSSRGRP
jgi:hypothetical protein